MGVHEDCEPPRNAAMASAVIFKTRSYCSAVAKLLFLSYRKITGRDEIAAGRGVFAKKSTGGNSARYFFSFSIIALVSSKLAMTR
jgi:hypothetical protein